MHSLAFLAPSLSRPALRVRAMAETLVRGSTI
jgi:hypothetical protein